MHASLYSSSNGPTLLHMDLKYFKKSFPSVKETLSTERVLPTEQQWGGYALYIVLCRLYNVISLQAPRAHWGLWGNWVHMKRGGA